MGAPGPQHNSVSQGQREGWSQGWSLGWSWGTEPGRSQGAGPETGMTGSWSKILGSGASLLTLNVHFQPPS